MAEGELKVVFNAQEFYNCIEAEIKASFPGVEFCFERKPYLGLPELWVGVKGTPQEVFKAKEFCLELENLGWLHCGMVWKPAIWVMSFEILHAASSSYPVEILGQKGKSKCAP